MRQPRAVVLTDDGAGYEDVVALLALARFGDVDGEHHLGRVVAAVLRQLHENRVDARRGFLGVLASVKRINGVFAEVQRGWSGRLGRSSAFGRHNALP